MNNKIIIIIKNKKDPAKDLIYPILIADNYF